MKKIIIAFVILAVCTLPISSAFAANTTIYPGTEFTPGKWYWSPGRTVFLVLQGDGNFVLYRYNSSGNHDPLWNTGTNINLQTRAFFQHDGNLVVYYHDLPLWASGTAGNPKTKFQIADEGFIAIVDETNTMIWHTLFSGCGQ